MPLTLAKLLEIALALPEAERVELVERLEASLPAPPLAWYPDWAVELRRRAAEIDAGQVRPIPWDEVQRQVQAQLDADGSLNGY